MIEPGKVLTAMVTPFDKNLEVDLKRAAELAEYLVKNGSDGLLVAGTTGETPTLTSEEKLALFRTVKETVGDKVFVLAGTGGNNTRASIELTRKAAELSVDAVMLTGPYYNKPSQEGFYEHFKAVATSTELPVVLYNVPARTSKNIEASTVLRLASELDNVFALKEAGGDFAQISDICAGKPADFRVYSGEDGIVLPMLSVGCHGVISVVSHLVGPQMAEMIRAYDKGNVQRACELHQFMIPIFKACFLASGSPACVKRGLEIVGFPVGGIRLPLVPASDADTVTIREACRMCNLI